MTNHWRDFKNSDVILVIGANPAENHPCGWKWAHVGRDERGTKIIHVDPRFTRTSAIADLYAPIRAGTDVAFFGGLINYILEKKLYHEDYVKLHTNAAFLVAGGFEFNDGLFSGYDEAKRTLRPDHVGLRPAASGGADGGDAAAATTPAAQPSSGGGPALGSAAGGAAAPVAPAAPPAPVAYAKTDPTLQDPRCVFQLMKAHYSRYTPEKVSEITGMPVEKFPRSPSGSARRASAGQGRQHRLRRGSDPPHHRACRSSGPSAWSRCCWATSAGPAAGSTPSGATPTSRGTPTTPSAGRSSPATSGSPGRA